MQKVNFDPERHVYTVDGAVLPSVTQVLVAEGFIDTQWFTEWARERGTLVHMVTQLDDTGELDEDTVDPVLAPYLCAYRRFKADTGFIPSEIEVPLVNTVYGFAGTPDRFGTFRDGTCVLLDIKSGAMVPATALQTAAYGILKGSPYKRIGVQLKDDGSYRLHHYNDRQDRNVFLAALAVYHWKQNNLKERKAA